MSCLLSIWSLEILEVQHVVPDISVDVSSLQIVFAVWCCVGLCDVLAAFQTCMWSCSSVKMRSVLSLLMCCVDLCGVASFWLKIFLFVKPTLPMPDHSPRQLPMHTFPPRNKY